MRLENKIALITGGATGIGQALVDGQALTSEQIDHAVGVQADLRRQKLGDILLNQQVVTPDQLVGALEQQSRMPMVRIGEALIALSLITEEQLHDALRQQQSDRTVPLGELLVRLGLITRHDLLSALARKMGYPLVDLQKFPVDPLALHKVPFTVASEQVVGVVQGDESTSTVVLNKMRQNA